MKYDYRLETLASTFSDHAEMIETHQEQINKMYTEQNPGQELPEHMKNPFNIAKALSVMAEELNKLKECSVDHMINEHPFV